MTSPNIFATNAPIHYAHGLQVLPLFEREKRPIVSKWSQYSETAVPPETQAEWIEKFPHGNMGLALGKASGIICIDIDTDNQILFDAILAVLPPSPWARRGKKGVMLAFKYSPIKTFRVKDADGAMIVECLGNGTQCVMPPSIHPETLQPYASNTPLYEVLPQLNTLPTDIEELLRTALTNAGVKLSHSGWSKVTEFTSAGSRDTTLTELAGLFAFAVTRGERTLKQAIGMLSSYAETFVENVAGDAVDVNKHVQNLVKFLHRDVVEKNKILPKGWDDGYTNEELVSLGVSLGTDQTEWGYDEIKTYLYDVFDAAQPGSKDRVEAVEFVLKKMSRTKNFSKLDEDRVLDYIKSVGRIGVSVPSLRARIKELKQGEVKGANQTEVAKAFLNDLKQYMQIAYHNGGFFKWNGSHWESLKETILKSMISENYGHLDVVKKASDIKGILDIVTYTADQGIQTLKVSGVNFANGFLTQDLKLLPHDKAYGATYTLPFRYIPEIAGQFPMFEAFLKQSWGHDADYEQKLLALQEALAVTLFGLGSKYQRAILLHGAASSGKTQLLRIVQMLVPEEGRCAVPPETWGSTFMPAQFSGKILNICGELSESKLIAGETFKDIIDGTEISVQHKNQQIFKMAPILTHWFASNHFPRTRDTSSGFTRRWLVFSFNKPVPSARKVADIGELIAGQEREAIVAWAAAGLVRVLTTNGYTIPASHHEVIYEVATMNNTVKFYLEESGKVKLKVSGRVSENKIYMSYWGFCSAAGGVKPAPQHKFRSMMRELQSEYGFRVEMTPTAIGGTECLIDGIQLVG